jgi:hypothetical protein
MIVRRNYYALPLMLLGFAVLVFECPAVANADPLEKTSGGGGTGKVSTYQAPLTTGTSFTQLSSPTPPPPGGGGDVSGGSVGNQTVNPAPGGFVLVLCALPFLCLGYWWSQRRRAILVNSQG